MVDEGLQHLFAAVGVVVVVVCGSDKDFVGRS